MPQPPPLDTSDFCRVPAPWIHQNLGPRPSGYTAEFEGVPAPGSARLKEGPNPPDFVGVPTLGSAKVHRGPTHLPLGSARLWKITQSQPLDLPELRGVQSPQIHQSSVEFQPLDLPVSRVLFPSPGSARLHWGSRPLDPACSDRGLQSVPNHPQLDIHLNFLPGGKLKFICNQETFNLPHLMHQKLGRGVRCDCSQVY